MTQDPRFVGSNSASADEWKEKIKQNVFLKYVVSKTFAKSHSKTLLSKYFFCDFLID
jgi:hypothetical protein